MLFGVLFNAILLIGGIGWCIAILRRFPDDLTELREKYRKYKTRNDPVTLEFMQAEDRRLHYRKRCASDFWTTLSVHAFFFWPATVIVFILVIRFLFRGIILPIVNAFR